MTHRYRFIGRHLDDLHDGRVLEPGAYVTLTDSEKNDPHNQHRITEGLLIPAPTKTAKEGSAT